MLLRTSGFISLPSDLTRHQTLRDYTHYFTSTPGFQTEIFQQLQKEVESLPESRKYVGIVIDEMKIKEGLVYNKYTGAVVYIRQLVHKTRNPYSSETGRWLFFYAHLVKTVHILELAAHDTCRGGTTRG